MSKKIITKKKNLYNTEESCLSLVGFRETTRYETIEVEYLKKKKKKHKDIFTGFTAQLIQHEIDHFNGKII